MCDMMILAIVLGYFCLLFAISRWTGRHPAAVQLLEASKSKKGSGQPNRNKVGSVTWDQVKAIAEDKMADLNCFTVESAMRLVAGTARSMGITVKGDFPGE